MKTPNDKAISTFKALSKKYPTPEKVQGLLKSMKYNREEESETCHSAWVTYQKKEGHCLEATLLAAAILEHQNYPPLILSLDSIDHLNHAIFIFKAKTGWGSVGRSREPGLHGREPRFKTVKDLADSYYDPFVDKTGELMGYQELNLDESDTNWRFSSRNLWKLEKFVVYSGYKKIPRQPKRHKKFKAIYDVHGSLTKGKYWW